MIQHTHPNTQAHKKTLTSIYFSVLYHLIDKVIALFRNNRNVERVQLVGVKAKAMFVLSLNV